MTTETTIDITTPRDCTRCQGKGTREGYWAGEGRQECSFCRGKKQFPGLTKDEVRRILAPLQVMRKGKLTFRASKPNPVLGDEQLTNRQWYVWRMARFHGGIDVTMPVMATTMITGDPFEKELDKIADQLARIFFGTNMAAAHRWGRALGWINEDVPGLPASAYSGGPVADGNKPLEELIELR
jgi:hypothetical protein